MGPVSEDNIPSSTQTINVSRTVQSTDLFTPYREPRVTLPTIGTFQQDALPFGGKYWGGPLTEYGGIGDLAFIGRQRVRDLEVTRSHRHYRSGFSKYLAEIQPYRLTQLHLSECRINDQILPPPLQTDISGLNWQREDPWPNSQAYGTHRSIFEVFPSIKPEPSQQDRESACNFRSFKAQPLGKATQKALLDLNKKLYQTTRYVDSYRNYCSCQKLDQPMPDVPDSEDGTDAGQTNDADDEDDTEDSEDEEKENEEVSDEETRDGVKDAPDKSESNSSLLKKTSTKSVTFNDAPQIMDETFHQMKVIPNKPMAGVGPRWPPGDSYVIDSINGCQLVERADITQSQPAYYGVTGPTAETKPPRLLSARARLAKQFKGNLAHGQGRGRAPTLVASLKSQDAFLKERMPKLHHADGQHYSTNQRQDGTASANGIASCCRATDVVKNSGIKLPVVRTNQTIDQPFLIPPSFRKPSLVLPPAPLADCLPTTGSRTPHKLGLRYKSEAHKRYHLMYPDNIPDLRTNRKEGKKYFFCNFHSSVFRG
ncbi:uncharacterized protein LOC119741483 [Patiria miniata]|uniref:Uncharacterized protein n=1 Tax=Patiria miniata TaxID=46514 RepID=A0A914BCK9_PATMI|nr:uncharacterized protein LOC119741483 [Patiria miniata]